MAKEFRDVRIAKWNDPFVGMRTARNEAEKKSSEKWSTRAEIGSLTKGRVPDRLPRVPTRTADRRRSMAAKDFIKYLKYRDEFLIRNEEYVRDYVRSRKKILEHISLKSPDKKPTFGKFAKEDAIKIHQIFHSIIAKWGSLPVPGKSCSRADQLANNPSELWLQLYRTGYRKAVIVPNLCLVFPGSTILNSHAYFRGEELEEGIVTLKIDLAYSKKRIVQELEIAIDLLKESYEAIRSRHNKKKGPRNQSKKYHFENFDLYLKVWDMRKKENKSWSEITSALKLNSPQTARNHYRAACRLIRDGIEFHVK